MSKQDIINNYVDIVNIAKLASSAIMSVYDKQDNLIKNKEDQSPLTIADEMSHNIIVEHLEKYNIPIISEEGGNIPYEERKKWDLYWLIDPLDGTKEFIKKNGEFTVNIALIEYKKPVFGVVALPTTKEIYVGGDGLTGLLININGEKKLYNKLENNCENVIVVSRSHLNEDTLNYVNSRKESKTIKVGSSLKFMMLTINKASVYPRFGPTMEWDIAASHAILKSLDYNILNLEGVELDYNKKDLLNPYFIAQ